MSDSIAGAAQSSGSRVAFLAEEAHFDAVVRLIYEAASDTTRWSDVAVALSNAIGGHPVSIWLRLPGSAGRYESYRSDPEVVSNAVFRQHWIRGLPWGNTIAREGPARETLVRFVDFSDLLPDERVADTDYYRDWLAPRGIAPRSPVVHVFAVEGDLPRGTVSLNQRASLPPLEPRHIAFADRLVPHFRRAHRMLCSLRSMRREQDVFREVIDRLPTGLLLLDEAGRVVAMNEAARLSVESAEGLRVEAGRPVVDDAEENAWLQDAIERARQPSARDAQDAERVLAARRSGGDAQIPVLVTPLLAPASESTLPDTAAMIFLGNPKLAYVTATHLLRDLYQLTRAEADLTWLLADGLSLEQAAERRGVTLNTARSQLKRVFNKTGVRRQSDLVRIVLGRVGVMRGRQ